MVDGPGADRGMVFQAYTLFPWLTVRNNVEYGLQAPGRARLPSATRSSEHYLDEIGLSGFRRPLSRASCPAA